ncbi:multiheme c-type cytochrome [Desulfurivibrio alkaliphilus]|uniref:Cytochrome c-552/4 domain-containing protein n=1 Tax=Desulfurivibrio alkaliphilus (strain DSM 19089 / UNIQEM U267 / AHT2) TaxID=589865 RepID=D6Z5W8_DESAT|nr:multiheme c-type cytochrome [Desulfurivibrio alkaliphilus]ADH84850.1 conserved hypothetical protein [Desulfurivibrio alkaliphilus AHT 2]
MKRAKLWPMFALLVCVAFGGWSGFAVFSAVAGEKEQVFAAGSFEDPEVCARCHRDIYQEWSHSMHAYAWDNQWFRADYEQAHRETGGATDMLCGPCHAPVAARTGQLPPHDGSEFDAVSQRGVSCDFCHTVTGLEQVYNMGHVSEPGRVKRGPRGDGREMYHAVEFSELHTRAEFCGSCHQVIHPATGVAIIDTYQDWQNNEYGQKNIRCQDCHMTPTPGVGQRRGRAATMGENRSNVAFHAFSGGSVYVQEFLGHREQARMAREMLRAAAVVELSPRVTNDATLELTVDVRNVGAGHKIPTGVTYIRKMWLQVEVLNGAGEKVYSSGHLVEGNHVDPEAVFFRLLFVDEQGELTGKSWRAQGIGYDRRIAANSSEREVYRIGLPARSDYTINTRLMYRSFSQATIERLEGILDKALPPLGSVEMAKATAKVSY